LTKTRILDGGRASRAAVAAALLALAAGCATTPRESAEGRRLIAEGRYEEGLALMEQAAKAQPRHPQAYTSYITQRDAIVHAHVRDADALRTAGEFDAAEAQYRTALRLDPTATLAHTGLEALAIARQHREQVATAQQSLQQGDLAAAERLARAVLEKDSTHRGARAVMKTVADRRAAVEATPPRLREALKRQVSIELRDAPLRTIFEIISKTGDINFVFDRDVKTDARTTIMVRDTTLDDVVRVLLLTNQLDRKVLNENSVLVYPATQAKQREYQELVMRSFYLANADAKQTAAMIRAMVKTRDLFVDEKINLIVMRDTPDAVRLAEQLVATQDLGEPEVMLEIEVLEVASSLVQEFGVRYPDQVSIVGTNPDGTAPDPWRLSSRGLRAFVPNPVLLLNLRRSDGTTNLLANPRIRVKNRDKAKVHIGQRVPVITTTSTANVGVSSSVNYLETGLKLDVEPNIFLENEVSIKIELEVSNILEQLNVSGTVAYRLGTRNAATTLRLKDGETQVLAGLINSEERNTFTKVPYASDLPVLGRLFRNDDLSGSRTEIVLLVTPRVVRNLQRPDTVQPQFPSGTEAVPSTLPVRLSSASSRIGMSQQAAAGPAQGAPGPAPAAQQKPGRLNIAAPSQAGIGQEFAVTLSFPSDAEQATASVQLSYDPAVLNVVGVTPPPGGGAPAAASGSVAVDVATQGIAGTTPTPTQVRFRVVAKAPTAVDIGLDVINASRAVEAPTSLPSISIVGK
jgi:general secretion pathway protein D